MGVYSDIQLANKGATLSSDKISHDKAFQMPFLGVLGTLSNHLEMSSFQVSGSFSEIRVCGCLWLHTEGLKESRDAVD